jgi:hypothetical protein
MDGTTLNVNSAKAPGPSQEEEELHRYVTDDMPRAAKMTARPEAAAGNLLVSALVGDAFDVC